jgi:hypothetical protein
MNREHAGLPALEARRTAASRVGVGWARVTKRSDASKQSRRSRELYVRRCNTPASVAKLTHEAESSFDLSNY